MGAKPTPAKVSFLDMEMYGVPEPGWYLFDDNHRYAGGPFASREDAVAALGSPSKKSKTKSKTKKKAKPKFKSKRRK
jgi:hypothetical protein